MRNHKLWFLTLLSTIFILGSLLFLQVGLEVEPAQAQTEQGAPTAPVPQTITVVGEGTARVAPDTAQATIGVQIIDGNLSEATSTAQQQMEAVLAALTAQGIAEEDIQTTNFNIFVERPVGPDGQASEELVYHVNNDVQVTIRELDNIGAVLEAAIGAGANNIYGVTFRAEDPNEARSEARALAIEDASAKAQELAGLAGVELGNVVYISEIVNFGGVMPFAERMIQDGGGGGPILPGQQEITIRLEVAYAMQ